MIYDLWSAMTLSQQWFDININDFDLSTTSVYDQQWYNQQWFDINVNDFDLSAITLRMISNDTINNNLIETSMILIYQQNCTFIHESEYVSWVWVCFMNLSMFHESEYVSWVWYVSIDLICFNRFEYVKFQWLVCSKLTIQC